jgi:hypothetical protein
MEVEMDASSRAAYAQRDHELTAWTVRNLAKIEDAYFGAFGFLSDRLMSAVVAAMRDTAPGDWLVEDDGAISLTCSDWQSAAKSALRSDAWLQIEEIAHDDNEHSWIAAAIAAGPTSMCLELKLRRGLAPLNASFSVQPERVAALLDCGFEQNEGDRRLIIPITIDAEALAVAFERDDFAEALAPVRFAVGVAVAAKGEIDKLLGHLRQPSKRR